jgi:branched-chain amino acid transport system ATP-binding protein
MSLMRGPAKPASTAGTAASLRARQAAGDHARVANVLDVERLSVAYGKVLAVRDVSLHVAPGTIVTVIGPNGAGKTTLLGAIAGLLAAQGVIRCFGEIATPWPVEERVRRGLVLVPEKRELFASMSVADNLQLGGFARRRDRASKAVLADVYDRFPRLAERRSQLAGTLSGGERQMLALGRALMAQPKLLLLDEPSLGLAPLVVRDIFAIIATLRSTGVALLLVEQNARAALQVADYGYVLETGELALEGPSAELAANPRVAATYLGQGRKTRAG